MDKKEVNITEETEQTNETSTTLVTNEIIDTKVKVDETELTEVCDAPDEDKDGENTEDDEIKETDDSPVNIEDQFEASVNEVILPDDSLCDKPDVENEESDTCKEDNVNGERESSKEKDSDSCETVNDECEEAKSVEEIICDEAAPVLEEELLEGDSVETLKVEEVDIFSMRKESLKNIPWVDSEDDSDIPDPDLDIPQNKILWAAEKNEIEALRQLLEEDPTLVNSRDEDGYTPLHRASYNNHVEVMKLLLTYNADMGAKTEDQWEPLHCACKWDSVETASLLIQNGANVNATTKGGLTPLHLAASNTGGRRTLELLLWHPYVDPTIKSERGDTAYDTACQNSPHYKLFEMIDISINCY